jgi:hypothetical protein
MKKYIISLSIIAIVLASCTKETVTEKKTTVPYVAPALGIYGTWKVTQSSNSGSAEEYMIITKGDNFIYNFTKDMAGFKEDYVSIYDADDKTFNWDGWLVNYKIIGDTMTWMTSPTTVEYKMVKDNSGTVTIDNWAKNLNIASTGVLAEFGSDFSLDNYGFGVKGDFLYISGRRGGQYRIYELNTLNGQLVDSVNYFTRAAIAYRGSSSSLYYGRASGTDKIKKSAGLGGAESDLSTNTISNARNISYNASSGTVYVYNSNRVLYAGSDGGNFSELADLSTLSTSFYEMMYYKNDEFIVERNSTLHRVKIAPTFTVVESYKRDNNFRIYNFGTDGSTIWVYGRNNMTNNNEYRKVTL